MAETRNTELNESRKESNQVTDHPHTEVEVRTNQNTGVDDDETRGRCYWCCLSCKACYRPCMTEHNPLPASPTRFDVILIRVLSVVAVCCMFSEAIPDDRNLALILLLFGISLTVYTPCNVKRE